MAYVGIKEINGTKYEIHAGQYGSWSIQEEATEHDGRSIGSHPDNLDKAIANARTQLAKEKVKLNIHFIDTEGQRGVAIGRHGRTREILIRVNGKAGTLKYSTPVFRPDMPQSEIDDLLKIDDKVAKLLAEKREIIQEWKFDIGDAVDKAIQEAAGN
jgi:hypothetical protein